MRCNCGKLISRHMHGKCFACRYEGMKKSGNKEPVQCIYCGKQFMPGRSYAKYCSDDCRMEAQKERDRSKKSMKMCLWCGQDFEAPRYSSRRYCDECKDKRQDTPKIPKTDSVDRAQKMRKIKASGMTYGQYMANKGIKPEEPEAYKGTLTTTQSWMSGPETVQVHPDVVQDPPKARLRRKVI